MNLLFVRTNIIMQVYRVFIITVLLLLLSPSLCLAQTEGAILNFDLPETENPEMANFEVMAAVVRFLKNKNISDCDLFNLPNLYERNGDLCSQRALSIAQRTFSSDRLVSILKEKGISYRIFGGRNIKYPDIVSAVNKNKLIILVSHRAGSDWSIYTTEQFDLVVGYKYPNEISIYNPDKGLQKIYSTRTSREADGLGGSWKAIFIDSGVFRDEQDILSSKIVYDWGEYSPQSNPITSYLCRIKDRTRWAYGTVSGEECYINSLVQSTKLYIIEFIYVNSKLVPIWDSPGIYPESHPTFTKTGLIRASSNKFSSNTSSSSPICRGNIDGQKYYGEYVTKKEKGKVCEVYYDKKYIDVIDEVELFYLIPGEDIQSIEEYQLRQYFKEKRKNLLSRLNSLEPVSGKLANGQTVKAYASQIVDSYIEETKNNLVKSLDNEKFSGLKRYIEEDFPFIEKNKKIILTNVTIPTMPGQSFIDEKKETNFSAFRSPSLTKIEEVLFIRSETLEELKNSVDNFFKMIVDDKLLIELTIKGNPNLAEILIANPRGTKYKGYVITSIIIYRGKYNIRVSKKGFKEFIDNNFNLVQADKYIYNCELSPEKSEEPSVCRF